MYPPARAIANTGRSHNHADGLENTPAGAGVEVGVGIVVGASVRVGVLVTVGVALGRGVGVAGRGVGVAVAGGVTLSKSLSSGHRIEAEFSRAASDLGIPTVCFDIDPGAVQQNYELVKQNKEKFMLPLRMDLTNPSPDLGWHNSERESMQVRGPVDLVMALALIHHLAISNNVPLSDVADYFADLGEYLIIEFVPKSDSQVKRLLASRVDIFPYYNEEGFEAAFEGNYEILDKNSVEGSERTLYLMKRK